MQSHEGHVEVAGLAFMAPHCSHKCPDLYVSGPFFPSFSIFIT